MGKEFELSVDAKALVKAFESAPAKTRDMVRIQLKIAVESIKDYASDNHRYISRNHHLEREGIDTLVKGNTGYLWLDEKKVPYARFVHEGTKPRVIVPRNVKALRWVNQKGEFAFAKRVNFPGTKPDSFLYDAADHEEANIREGFARALQELLEDL